MMPPRKRRLPISSSDQPAPKFEVNAAFWRRCETENGQAVSREIREEVVATTNNVLWFASIETALDHIVGNATEQAYRRSDALEKRRDLMSAWSAFREPATKANVVQIRERRRG
jgi:hypothetical protein